jgi:hypothetical protein
MHLSLGQLLEVTPSVRARNGSEIILEAIIVVGRLDLGMSVFTVLGDTVEQFTVWIGIRQIST